MPHPCALDETLEGCAELAAEHALSTVPANAAASLKETLIANAPAITEQLSKAMLKIGDWVEATETFALEQTPLLVHEIVRWGIASAGFWVVIGVLLMLSNPAVRFNFSKSAKLKDHGNVLGAALNEKGDNGDFILALAGGIVLPIIGFFFIAVNIMDMLKPIITPRLYLVEYFQALVK